VVACLGVAGDVELVTLHGELRAVDLAAAIVDAAVALVGDAILESKFEVFKFPVAPDDERILFCLAAGRDLADEIAILDSPVLEIAIPALKRFAVEDRFESSALVGCR